MNTLITERQKKILELRLRGETQKEVGKKLGISQVTVSSHEKKAKEKVVKAIETLEFCLNNNVFNMPGFGEAKERSKKILRKKF